MFCVLQLNINYSVCIIVDRTYYIITVNDIIKLVVFLDCTHDLKVLEHCITYLWLEVDKVNASS